MSLSPPPPWLKHYAPMAVLRAADVLADHVDFWEEENFRTNGRWRNRELTEFIRSGMTADKGQCDQFKKLLLEYIEMSACHPPKNCKARERALKVAVAEVRRWMKVA